MNIGTAVGSKQCRYGMNLNASKSCDCSKFAAKSRIPAQTPGRSTHLGLTES